MPLPPAEATVHAMGLISVDGSVVVQMALFFLLMLILQRLLFKPVRASIRLRDERTVGARKEADEVRGEAEEKMARYDSALREAKKDAAAARRELREEGTARRNEALDAARADCEELLAESRTDLEKATATARQEVQASADALSREIVARLLGTSAVVLLTLLPAAAWAGGGGGEHGDWVPEFLWLALWSAINLAVLLWLLVKFGKRPTADFLANRRAEITRELEEATRLREEAAGLFEEYGSRLEGLDEEREGLLTEFREAGEAEKARLIEEGKTSAERMREEARRTIDQEIRKARVELEAEVLDRAVAQATEVLRKEAGPAEQGALVGEFLERVRALPAGEA